MNSTRGGQNLGGVGVLVRHPRKVKQIFPQGENPHFDKGNGFTLSRKVTQELDSTCSRFMGTTPAKRTTIGSTWNSTR
eukprot:4781019-Heterocapsa_arctica.AAC.1